jgi:chromosome partitioning protein
VPTIAVYNVKGGVGKTSIAVNLAWASAKLSARRTLLWDLDPQGGAGFLLGHPPVRRPRALALFGREIEAEKLIQKTQTEGFDLLPADSSLGGIDQYLITLDKKRRLARLTQQLDKSYDRIILDCPPILNEASDQVFRAADLLLVPITPSPLAMQALSVVRDHLRRHHKGHCPILPVFSMFDSRRKMHREALLANSDWPVIPMSSLVEQMALRHQPIGAFAAASKPGQAFASLWTGVERKVTKVAKR